MVDISNALKNIMQENQCSPLSAFLMLTEDKLKEEKKDGVYLLQPKPRRKPSR